MEILKLQTPLETNTTPAALVYNKGRTKTSMVEITQEIITIMKGRPKIFILGSLTKEGLQIHGEAPWQDW
jgi:hypothetical protein